MWSEYLFQNTAAPPSSCLWRYYAKLERTLISQKWHRLRAAQREPLVGFRATNLSQCHLVPSAQYHLCLKLSVRLCQQQVRSDPLCATQIWPDYISAAVTTVHFCLICGVFHWFVFALNHLNLVHIVYNYGNRESTFLMIDCWLKSSLAYFPVQCPGPERPHGSAEVTHGE